MSDETTNTAAIKMSNKGRLRHVAISVPDPWAVAPFYEEAFGLKKVGETDSSLARGVFQPRCNAQSQQSMYRWFLYLQLPSFRCVELIWATHQSPSANRSRRAPRPRSPYQPLSPSDYPQHLR